MVLLLFGIFLIIPLIEVALFVVIGGQIGILPTILLCIASAVAGALIVRHQGLHTLARLQQRLRLGEMPNEELADGAAILAAGVLLITPGFFTDAVGFMLLIPRARRLIIAWLGRHLSTRVKAFATRRAGNDPYPERQRGPAVIDVNAEEIDERK